MDQKVEEDKDGREREREDRYYSGKIILHFFAGKFSDEPENLQSRISQQVNIVSHIGKFQSFLIASGFSQACFSKVLFDSSDVFFFFGLKKLCLMIKAIGCENPFVLKLIDEL